jgi:hypothetical protein
VVFGSTYQEPEARGQGEGGHIDETNRDLWVSPSGYWTLTRDSPSSPVTTPLDIAGIICLTLDRVVMLSQVEEVQEDSVWNVSGARCMELILVNIRRITSCLIMLLDRHPQRSQTSQNSHHLGFKKS